MFKKITLLSLLFIGLSAHTVEEGMFPLSELSKLDLQKAGLKISTQEVYNPDGTSLVDALVRLSGCTGSFVSDKGLIITNHHCAFGSVAAISTPENNYLEEGFVAKDGSMEAKTSLTCRITKSYEDVSNKIVGNIGNVSPSEKAELIQKNIEKLEKEESEKHPDLTCEISEMFVGKSYTLFRYQVLTDVRLVYVPPRSIGEFGGETDNWVWPRHTGDFSFVRAYVAPDGTPREYNKDNVPFTPKKFLKVNPNGVEKDDFVFILGYPGRTYRHQPSQFIEYQNDYVLPFIADWFDWQINMLEELGRSNKEKELKYASRIKSLANVTKNFKGKMQGIDRTNLLDAREAEDKKAEAYINNNPELRAKYGEVFKMMDTLYQEKLSTANRDLWYGQLYNTVGLFFRSSFVAQYAAEMKGNPKGSNKLFLTDKNDALVRHLKSGYGITDMEFDRRALIELLTMAQSFEGANKIQAVNDIENVEEFVNNAYAKSKLTNGEWMVELLKVKPHKLFRIKDPLIEFAAKIQPEYIETAKRREKINDEIDALMPLLLEAKMEYSKKNFIPDANSTLRFTYGYVKGYSPQDAVYNDPFTSIEGLLEKATLKEGHDYYMPEFLQEKIAAADNTRFINKAMKTVPVGILYNLDTTGGNSGSPILDANGDLIGVNFDRAFTATINDYAWDEKYSRSIGVDIRFILFFLTEVAEADYLVEEMGVKL